MATATPAGPVLCFDLDGVCCDLASKWLAVYNRDWHDTLSLDDITEWEWDRFVKPECGFRVYHYLSRPGFFADLAPLPGAVESLRRLQQRCELVVVTASPRPAMADKAAWVRHHLPFVPKHNLVITHRKDLVRGDIMIDDAPRNLRHFAGERILFDYPYNRDFQECHRVRGWPEAEALVHRLLDPRAGARSKPP